MIKAHFIPFCLLYYLLQLKERLRALLQDQHAGRRDIKSSNDLHMAWRTNSYKLKPHWWLFFANKQPT